MMHASNQRHLLGLDYGTVWVGMAIGELSNMNARPLGVFRNTLSANKALPGALIDAFRNWQPCAVVMGSLADKRLTKNPLLSQLQAHYPIAIFSQLEDSSTSEARAIIKGLRTQGLIGQKRASKRRLRDAASAAVILQRWFDNV